MAVFRFSKPLLVVDEATTEGSQGDAVAILSSDSDTTPDHSQAFALVVSLDPEPEGSGGFEGDPFAGADVPVQLETSADGEHWVTVPLVGGASASGLYTLGSLGLHVRASLEATDDPTTVHVALCSTSPFSVVAA